MAEPRAGGGPARHRPDAEATLHPCHPAHRASAPAIGASRAEGVPHGRARGSRFFSVLAVAQSQIITYC
jgi:hypothetical protein